MCGVVALSTNMTSANSQSRKRSVFLFPFQNFFYFLLDLKMGGEFEEALAQ